MQKIRNDIFQGAKFGKLTVTGKQERRNVGKETRVFWECICDCGNIKWVAQHNLGTSTNSCGCKMSELNKSRATHNKTKDRIYRTRINMRKRCNDPKDKGYSRYGGRGIKVCDERGKSFIKFYEDMGKSYEEHVALFGEKDTTIDRIDVNGNYCKENCRWATIKEQANNRRR